MIINSVLQKYPELKRPEAVFEISSIALSYMCPDVGVNEMGPRLEHVELELFEKVINCNIKAPFMTIWYEYNWGENKRGVLLETEGTTYNLSTFFYSKKRNIIFRLDLVSVGTNDYKLEENTPIDYFSYRPASELEEIKAKNNEDGNRLYLQAFILPALLVNALLNCKNVVVASHDFPNRRSIKHYRTIGKPYFEKYYTLKLRLSNNKESYNGSKGEGEYTNAFHICRGHFKTYMVEKPLLGKFTGTYWWNSHIRGDMGKGIIDKDYVVEKT